MTGVLVPTIDDRMACAIELIDLALLAQSRAPLSLLELRALRDPKQYRTIVNSLPLSISIDVSEPLALLDEWHSWHGGS